MARLLLLALLTACTARPQAVAGGGARTARSEPPPTTDVVPASPPRDDGGTSLGARGGREHSAALAELAVARPFPMADKQRSFRFPLPDALHWTRVRFFRLPTLLGLRYGKDHHAVVAATVQPRGAVGTAHECAEAFEAWGAPRLDELDVDVSHDEPRAIPWHGDFAEVRESSATTEGLLSHDVYAVAYAAYPAWSDACLILGIAVPARGDEARARAVRDRFAHDVLPAVRVMARDAPTKLE